MKRLLALSLLSLALAGCDKPAQSTSQASPAPGQCAKDIDCKGDRICESGQCVSPGAPSSLAARPQPAAELAPAAPSVAYQAVLVGDEGAGPFSISYMELGTALNYQSRAGVMNVMEYVVEDPEATGYVAIEKAYSFGPSKYVLIVSTGESGNSCPATTYAVSFDTASESVDGKTSIDGCSETVEAMSEGNKLTIKKEGETTVVFNGIVK